MSFEKLLKTSCIIQQSTKTQTATGEQTVVWTTKATTVTSRNKNISPKIFDEKLKVYKDEYRFYFKNTEAITVANRIKIGSDVYEVTSVDTDSRGHHLKVYATKTIQK